MDMVVVDLAAAPDLREGDWLDVPYSLPDKPLESSGLSSNTSCSRVLGVAFGAVIAYCNVSCAVMLQVLSALVHHRRGAAGMAKGEK